MSDIILRAFSVTNKSVLFLERDLNNKEDFELDSEDESSGTGSGMVTRTEKKNGYIVRRINPTRKCKTGKVSPTSTLRQRNFKTQLYFYS